MMSSLKAFSAGFLSTLIFHQGTMFLLYKVGMIGKAPFNFNPTWPLGVPAFISLAFFGGLWGILIWQLIKNDKSKLHWIKALVLGAIGPTAVAMLVVFPLKGIDVVFQMWVGGFILNGMWGIGNTVFAKLFKA